MATPEDVAATLGAARKEAAVTRRAALAAMHRGNEKQATSQWSAFQKQDAKYGALARKHAPAATAALQESQPQAAAEGALPFIKRQLAASGEQVRAARMAVRAAKAGINASASTRTVGDAVAGFKVAKAKHAALRADREHAIALQRASVPPPSGSVHEAWAQDHRFGGQTKLLREGAMAALKLSAEFSEDDHPRDKDGKFAPAANGGGAAERQAKYSTVPDRAFVATVTNHDGSSVTKTVYGKHPSDAENRHLAENKDAKRVVVRSELRETDPGYKKPGFMDRVKGAVAKVKEALKSDPSGGWDAYEQEKAARAAAGVHEPSADYGQDDDEGSHRNRGDSRPLGGLKIGMLSHDAVEGRNLLAWMGFDLFDWNEEDHPRGAGGKFATGDDASKHASIMDKVRGIIAQHREKVAAREADDAKYAAAAHKEEISATASKIYWAHKNAAEKDGYAQHIKSAETAAGRALTSDEKKKVMMDADDAMRTMARKTAETIDKATYGDNGEKYKAPKADFVLKADTWKNASWR